jgi:hypothetical protein
MAAMLAWRRTAPRPAIAVAMAAYALLAVLDIATDDLNSLTATMLVLVYSAAMWMSRSRALIGLITAAAAATAVIGGAVERVTAAALFVLIGADPCTNWLPSELQRDDWGYIATGGDCECHIGVDGERPPLMFETTMPGVFAVGDVRQGSIKRVASAAGDGAVCVRVIHDYLDEQSRRT